MKSPRVKSEGGNSFEFPIIGGGKEDLTVEGGGSGSVSLLEDSIQPGLPTTSSVRRPEKIAPLSYSRQRLELLLKTSLKLLSLMRRMMGKMQSMGKGEAKQSNKRQGEMAFK